MIFGKSRKCSALVRNNQQSYTNDIDITDITIDVDYIDTIFILIVLILKKLIFYGKICNLYGNHHTGGDMQDEPFRVATI